jgi:hypothetical protein
MKLNRMHSIVLMAALGAMTTAGGAVAASAPAETVYPDDGKIRLEHKTTGQVCEFDTREAVDNFGANVADPHDWALIEPTTAPAASDVASETAAAGPATGETTADPQ